MNRFFTTQRMALILLLTVVSLLAAACSGADGAPGNDGQQGPPGAAGPAGEQGAQGTAGQRGPAGSDGSDGAAGAKGDTGARGPTGPTGPTGADGADGATGATGATGPAGSDGESTHSNVQLSSTYVEPNVALTIVAYLTGWADGEGVSLSLVSGEDGSTTAWGSGAADATGMAMVELTHDGLGSGFYSVLATGTGGGKASDVLVSGDKPLAQ